MPRSSFPQPSRRNKRNRDKKSLHFQARLNAYNQDGTLNPEENEAIDIVNEALKSDWTMRDILRDALIQWRLSFEDGYTPPSPEIKIRADILEAVTKLNELVGVLSSLDFDNSTIVSHSDPSMNAAKFGQQVKRLNADVRGLGGEGKWADED